MTLTKTELPGVTIIEPKVFKDSRGFFVETFQRERYQQLTNGLEFVQDNHSLSTKGVLRGLHFQKERPQGKLVRVVDGDVYDVAVDVNPKSPTFGKWVSVHLSGENQRQVYIPPGYAHGFQVLSEKAHFEYKCTDYYVAEDQEVIAWNDPDLSIPWPIADPDLSDKDRSAPLLNQRNVQSTARAASTELYLPR